MKKKEKPQVTIDGRSIKIDKRIGLSKSVLIGSMLGATISWLLYTYYRTGVEHAVYNTLTSIENGVLTIDDWKAES